MRLRSRMPRSMPTSDKLLESAASVEVRTLPVHLESKKTHVSHAPMFPLDRKVARRCNRFAAIAAHAPLGFLAMFANVGQENPAEWIFVQRHRTRDLISFCAVLFQKHYMAPRRCAEMAGVVVRISGPNIAVIRHLVPFFARDFASLTSNANSRIGKKSHFDVIAHVGVLPLIRTLNAFADHRLSIFPFQDVTATDSGAGQP